MTKSKSINQFLETKLNDWSSRIALQNISTVNGVTYTYAELVNRFKQGAKNINNAGIKAGDRIVLIAENSPEWVIAYLSAIESGATVVLIDPKYSDRDLGQLMEKSDSRLLLLSVDIFKQLLPNGLLGLPALNINAQLEGFECTPSEVDPASPDTEDPDTEVASIIFTSGTGGPPKGVLVTHESLLHCAKSALEVINIDGTEANQNALCILPLHHMSGLTSVLMGPLLGGATVTFPEVVDKEHIFNAFSTKQITVFTAVPRFYDLIYKGIVNEINKKDAWVRTIIWQLASFSYWLRSHTPLNIAPVLFGSIHKAFGGKLEYFFCGGSHLDPKVKLGMEKLGFTLLEGYGLTETGVCVYNGINKARLGHVGKPCDGVDIRIAEPDKSTGDGEICIRGINVMKGYFRDEKATGEVLRDGWLHTGDLGHLDAEGNLVISGRIKDIIITAGGKKASPSEVEEYYRDLPGVAEIAVFGMPAQEGVGESVQAAVILEGEFNQSDISEQEAIADNARTNIWQEIENRSSQIPIFLRIQKIHILTEFPKTTTLKVRRKQLQQSIQHSLLKEKARTGELKLSTKPVTLDRASLLAMPEQAQAEQLEAYLRYAVSHSLHRDLTASELDESLLSLGIDSLNAAELANKLRSDLDWELPLEQLLRGANIPQLVASWSNIQAQQNSSAPTLRPVSRQEPLPLSFSQERLWFLNQLDGTSATYNIPGAVRIKGRLEVEALQQALSEIGQRHETLRTSFLTVDGIPQQKIHAQANLQLEVVDLQLLDKEQQSIALTTHIQKEANKPFDLAALPLIRCRLLKSDIESYVLLITMHHIISDGWSIGILIRELSGLYQAISTEQSSPLTDISIHYADFAVWQKQWLQGERLENQVNYWRTHLTGAPDLLQLPTDRPRPNKQSHLGRTQCFRLPEQLSQQLGTLARQTKTTLFMTLQAAFATLLYRYSGQSDILIGSPIANRSRQEIEPLIGFFVNTLVLRNRFENNPTFESFLAQVKETTLNAYEHQDLPFEQIIEAVQPRRSLSHSPLFQVMFVLQNSPMEELQLPGITLTEIPPESTVSKFDITLSMMETREGLSAQWEYSSDLFYASTIERMAAHFENLLDAIVEAPHLPVGALPLLSKDEYSQITTTWNDTGLDYGSDLCIHQAFEQQVEKNPEKIALYFDSEHLSYGELNRRSNQLAHYLIEKGATPNSLVGICVTRSVDMIVGLLGIIKSGAAYVPLDPNYPEARIAYMVEDAKLSLILTQTPLAEKTKIDPTKAVYLDNTATQAAILNFSVENIAPHTIGLSSSNLAYIIYTSGSTGKPKGVMIRHANTTALTAWAEVTYSAEEFSLVAASTSICFDLSVYEIFVSLQLGGSILLLETILSLVDQVDPALKDKISLINTVPSAIKELHNAGDIPENICVINLAGELLKQELVEDLYASGVPKVYDLYGPSEDTTYSTYTLRSPGIPANIGRPIHNTQAYILGPNKELLPAGLVGELYLGGAGLAQGYLKNPSLTDEKFINNPFSQNSQARIYRTGDLCRYLADGNIEYIGRLDDQIKLRGFRIELGEIETALLRHPEISGAVVVNKITDTKASYLLAYVESQKTFSSAQLSDFLIEHLPSYMIPSLFSVLERFPLTQNGKTDRKALRLIEAEVKQVDYIAPENETEKILSELWSEVLGMDSVGTQANFFDLGGHSLLLVQVHTRLSQRLNRSIAIVDLFQYPTIHALAKHLNKNGTESSEIIANQTEQRQAGRSDRKRRKQRREAAVE